MYQKKYQTDKLNITMKPCNCRYYLRCGRDIATVRIIVAEECPHLILELKLIDLAILPANLLIQRGLQIMRSFPSSSQSFMS